MEDFPLEHQTQSQQTQMEHHLHNIQYIFHKLQKSTNV